MMRGTVYHFETCFSNTPTPQDQIGEQPGIFAWASTPSSKQNKRSTGRRWTGALGTKALPSFVRYPINHHFAVYRIHLPRINL